MAGVEDILDLFGQDPGAARNQAAALADAIRRRQGTGMALTALMGDRKQVGGMGGALMKAPSPEESLVPVAQHRAAQDIQRQNLERQNSVLENAVRHQRTMETIAAGRLDQGDQRIAAMTRALELRGIKYNPNTGEFVNVAPMAGRGSPAGTPAPAAPAGGALPGAVGAAQFPKLGGKMLDKALKDLGLDFDPSSKGGGEFSANQKRVNSAKRLLALAETPDGKPADLNPQQMPELAQALAQLITSGSVAAQSQIEHLTPKTMSGDYAKIAQWLTNEPKGAGQQAFVQNMIETAKREREVASQGIESVRGQRANKHQRVIRGNPDEARNVLKPFGWDIGPDGLPAPIEEKAAPAASPSAAGPAVRKFQRVNGKLVEVK